MLKDTEFAYAVARIRSNENKLLSSPVIESLISASSYNEAQKILSDAGYGDFSKFDEDKILSDVQERAFKLIYESAPDKKCLDFLIVKNDFHNIKALLKCMVSGMSTDGLLLSPSVVDAEKLELALKSKSFDDLEKPFCDIARRAYELVTTTMDGQTLEVFLDRKCLEVSLEFAMQSKDVFSIELSRLMAMLSNIKIALRCLNNHKDKDFILSALCPVGGYDINELCEACISGIDSLCAYESRIGFEKLAESTKQGYAAFEKTSDDMLIEKIRHAKYQCLGIAPLVAYYFASDAEIKTVRIILSCKKNDIDNELIRERVRELYV